MINTPVYLDDKAVLSATLATLSPSIARQEPFPPVFPLFESHRSEIGRMTGDLLSADPTLKEVGVFGAGPGLDLPLAQWLPCEQIEVLTLMDIWERGLREAERRMRAQVPSESVKGQVDMLLLDTTQILI